MQPARERETDLPHSFLLCVCVCVCVWGGEEGEEMRCGVETIFSSV